MEEWIFKAMSNMCDECCDDEGDDPDKSVGTNG